MTVHSCSKGHLLTPALKVNRRTSADRLLQWHVNVLFTDKKIFTIEEQYNHQNNKIYAERSCEVKKLPEDAGRPSPFLSPGLVGGVPSGGDTASFFKERG